MFFIILILTTNSKTFLNLIYDSYNAAFKITKNVVRLGGKTCPCMTAGLLNSINEKHQLYRLSLFSPECKKYYLCYKKY